jgi:serine protease AprX
MKQLMAILVISILFSHSALASKAANKIDPRLMQILQTKGSVDALVYLQKTKRIKYVYDRLRTSSAQKQFNLISLLKKKSIAHKSFFIQNVVLLKDVQLTTLTDVSALKEVESIRLNVEAKLHLPSNEFKSGPNPKDDDDIPSHLQIINAHKVWREFNIKGKGIVIGGADTGYFADHNAIRKQYRGNNNGTLNHNYNWHDAFNLSVFPVDDDGHGTHTMGTMVGYDGGANRIGVAPEAQWIGCRNMLRGVGSAASYLDCFEYFMAPYPVTGDSKKGRPDLAPHIINNSWACPSEEGCKGDELIGAVQAMKAAGIMVVAAAGNEGDSCSTSMNAPGNYSAELISVGAFNRFTNDAAYFSSRGPSTFDGGLVPLITAPGVGIRSSYKGGVDTYEDASGTSMASPHIAGAIALLWSKYPQLIGKLDKTIQILTQTAKPIRANQTCGKFVGGNIPNAVHGYGMLDIYAAILKAGQ